MKFRDHRWVSDRRMGLTSQGANAFVTSVNVSRTGMRFRGPVKYLRGDQVTLNVLGQSIRARIVWFKDGQGGLAFDRPLTTQQLLALRASGVPKGTCAGGVVLRWPDRTPFRDLPR